MTPLCNYCGIEIDPEEDEMFGGMCEPCAEAQWEEEMEDEDE